MTHTEPLRREQTSQIGAANSLFVAADELGNLEDGHKPVWQSDGGAEQTFCARKTVNWVSNRSVPRWVTDLGRSPLQAAVGPEAQTRRLVAGSGPVGTSVRAPTGSRSDYRPIEVVAALADVRGRNGP